MTDTSESKVILTPAERIAAIKLSLQAWVLGIIGFLPIIGLMPGILALCYYFRVRTRYSGEWNPAAAYLAAGGVLAAIGLIGSLIVVVTFVLVWIYKVGL